MFVRLLRAQPCCTLECSQQFFLLTCKPNGLFCHAWYAALLLCVSTGKAMDKSCSIACSLVLLLCVCVSGVTLLSTFSFVGDLHNAVCQLVNCVGYIHVLWAATSLLVS